MRSRSTMRIDYEMVQPADTTPVTIESAESMRLGELTAFQIVFSEDIAGSLQTDDILVRAKVTNEALAVEEWLYLPEKQAVLIMSPTAEAENTKVVIDAGAVADLFGNRLAESFRFQFEIEPIVVNRIPGDANLDGIFNSPI
ncbi:MAG: Ig-like domain-containing protein [Pirellulaceae bacterium]